MCACVCMCTRLGVCACGPMCCCVCVNMQLCVRVYTCVRARMKLGVRTASLEGSEAETAAGAALHPVPTARACNGDATLRHDDVTRRRYATTLGHGKRCVTMTSQDDACATTLRNNATLRRCKTTPLGTTLSDDATKRFDLPMRYGEADPEILTRGLSGSKPRPFVSPTHRSSRTGGGCTSRCRT